MLSTTDLLILYMPAYLCWFLPCSCFMSAPLATADRTVRTHQNFQVGLLGIISAFIWFLALVDIGVWLTDLRYLGEASEGTFVYWFITQWLQPLMCLDCVNVNLLSTNNFTNMALSLSGNQEVHKVDKRNLALDPLDSSSEQLLNRTKRVWTV